MQNPKGIHDNISVYLGLVLLALIWGTQFLVIKIGQEGVPPLLTVFFRFLTLAIVGQVAIFFSQIKTAYKYSWSRIGFGGFQALSLGLLYWSEKHLASSKAGMLFMTSPFFIALFAHFLVPNEKLNWRTILSLCLGLGGIILIARPGSLPIAGAETSAVIAVVLAAIFGALNKIFSKRLTSEISAPVMIRDLGVTVALVVGCGWLLFERHLPVNLTMKAVAAFLYLGCVGSAGANAIFLLLLRRHSVTAMSYLQFVTALVALFTGVLIGREEITAGTVSGATIILLGILSLAIPRPAKS